MKLIRQWEARIDARAARLLWAIENVEADPGTGGAKFATDEITEGADTLEVPYVKLMSGADASKEVIGGDAANGLDVDVTRCALPTGASTAANQATANTALAGIQTAVELIDNVVKAEDAAHSGGDVGIMGLTVRQDTAQALSGTDGDYQPAITDGSGRLHVNVGVSALPTGAATSAKQDTGNTSLATIAGAVSGAEMQVDIVSSALPSGAATAANQSTANTALAAIQTAVEALDNAVAGNEFQVDIVTSALPTGAATAARQDTGNTALGAIQTAVELVDDVVKAEDAAHSGGDKGIMALAVRKDSAAASSGTDGDYEPLSTNATGELRTTVGSSALPSGASTSALQGTANTALAAIQTAVETIDNAIAGNEMQVDVLTLPALPAGTNAIGKLAANSGVDIGDVDVTSQPARVATTDSITAKLATDKLQDGTTALTPKFASIDVASSGDNTIVAAVNPKKLRVLSVFLVAAGAVNVRFESGAGGTALTGQMNLAANGGFALPFNPLGWFETASNTLLNLELSGAVSVDGCLTYVEV